MTLYDSYRRFALLVKIQYHSCSKFGLAHPLPQITAVHSNLQESGRASIEQSDGPRPPITASQTHSQATPGTPEHRPMKRKLGLRIVQLDGPAEGSSSEDSDEGSSDSEVCVHPPTMLVTLGVTLSVSLHPCAPRWMTWMLW